MSVSSDEVNYLIFRYLQENGFLHSSFTFAYESMVAKSSISHSSVPPGALITILQKGLEYIAIEEHINDDGSVKEFDSNFSLLSPFICDAMAHREDRRIRRPAATPNHFSQNNNNNNSSSSSSNSGAIISNAGGDVHEKDSTGTGISPPPSIITLRHDRTTSDRWLLLGGHQNEVFMCHWSPVTRQLASGSADGMCRLWSFNDMDSSKWAGSDQTVLNLETSILPHSSNLGERLKDITSITWSPDGSCLATGCYDGMARIWDNNGNLKTELREHTGPVFSLKWNKQGNYILSGSYDRKIVVWNAKTGSVLKSYIMHSAPVLDVDWKDSEVFATCSSDKSIFVWKVSSKDPILKFEGHEDEVNSVCWSPGGHYLASCSDDSTAKIWSLEKGLLHDLVGHSKEIYTVKWTPTGPGSMNPKKELLLCTASFDGTVKVWSVEDGSLRFNLQKQGQPVYSISPSPSGDFLATGSFGGHVSVWSLSDGLLTREILGVGDTFDVSWSYDGSMLCSCFSTGVLNVLDISGCAAQSFPAIKSDSSSNDLTTNNDDKTGESDERSTSVSSVKVEITSSDNSSRVPSVEMNTDNAEASVNSIEAVAVGSDGSIKIADSSTDDTSGSNKRALEEISQESTNVSSDYDNNDNNNNNNSVSNSNSNSSRDDYGANNGTSGDSKVDEASETSGSTEEMAVE